MKKNCLDTFQTGVASHRLILSLSHKPATLSLTSAQVVALQRLEHNMCHPRESQERHLCASNPIALVTEVFILLIHVKTPRYIHLERRLPNRKAILEEAAPYAVHTENHRCQVS